MGERVAGSRVAVREGVAVGAGRVAADRVAVDKVAADGAGWVAVSVARGWGVADEQALTSHRRMRAPATEGGRRRMSVPLNVLLASSLP